MSIKTVPFSARISIEDAAFISSLEYEGASTPSDKLRALLAETRTKHTNSADYGQNLFLAQEKMGQIKHQVTLRQQQLGSEFDVITSVLDVLPELIATLQTCSAKCPQMNIRDLKKTELQVVKQLLRINKIILPMAVMPEVEKSEFTDHLFELVKMINNYRVNVQGE